MSIQTNESPASLQTGESAKDLANRMELEAEKISLAAEQILFETAKEDDRISLDSSQASVLRMAGLSSYHDLERARLRILAVKAHMINAGSNQQFAEAKKRLSNAVVRNEKLRPELESKIAELQAQLTKMEREQSEAQRVLNGYESARTALTVLQLLPKFIADRFNHLKLLACQGIKKSIAERESRLRVIDGVVATPADSDSALGHARTSAPHMVIKQVVGSRTIFKVDEHSWALYVQQLQFERPEVEALLEELQQQLEEKLSKLEQSKTFYIDQLPD